MMTEDRRKQLLGGIRRGVSLRSSALSAGVTEAHVRAEMKRDTAFADAIDKAQADAEVLLVAKMHELAQTDSRAASWLLERINPERYAPQRPKAEMLTEQEVRKIW
jgi:hypothetical protein